MQCAFPVYNLGRISTLVLYIKHLDWSIIMCLFHAFRATNEHKTSLATSEVHVTAEGILANALPQQLRQVQTQL
jgi:hypothetical protein